MPHYSACLSHVTTGDLNQFQFSVLSTLYSRKSYLSEEDMINIGQVLDLELTKIKNFPHNQGLGKFGRERTLLEMSTHFTGEYLCLLLYVCFTQFSSELHKNWSTLHNQYTMCALESQLFRLMSTVYIIVKPQLQT